MAENSSGAYIWRRRYFLCTQTPYALYTYTLYNVPKHRC